MSITYVRKSTKSVFTLLVLISAFQAGISHANEISKRDTVFFNSVPTVDQLEQHLFPMRTRGVVFKTKSEIATDEHAARTEPAQTSVGLPVLFHFGKTTLVESSKRYLDQIGELMMRNTAQRETLIIEGHTDAVGGDRYNRKLSELRALAVKDYLVTKFNIDPLRLFPEGKGESLLYNAENPRAAENRRVEFLRLQR